MTVRIEHDLLGDREIPAEVYWGIHTLRAIENFKISTQKISDVPQFVRSMVMVKKATAQANGALGAIKPEIAAAIEKACDEVLVKGRCLDQFPSDVYQGGAGTSVNMNTNEVIANLALEVLGHEKVTTTSSIRWTMSTPANPPTTPTLPASALPCITASANCSTNWPS